MHAIITEDEGIYFKNKGDDHIIFENLKWEESVIYSKNN